MLHQNDTVKTTDDTNMSIPRKSALLSNNFLGRSLTFMLMTIGLSVPTLVNAAQCPAGYEHTTLNRDDYRQWNDTTSATINVRGTSKVNAGLTIDGSLTHNTKSWTFHGMDDDQLPPDSNGAFYFSQSFRHNYSTEPVNIATMTFDKPIKNLQYSIYDIDADRSLGYGFWDDQVQLIAKDENGKQLPIDFTFIGSNVKRVPGTTDTVKSKDFFMCKFLQFKDECKATANITGAIKTLQVVYRNKIGYKRTNQFIEMTFDSFCAEVEPTLQIEKDDGITEVEENSITDYGIKVRNPNNSKVTNATLSDPNVSGLRKLSNIQCDDSVTNNACVTPPTVSQLESGFSLPTLAQGQTYAIIVPTQVTARSGSHVTNTATVQYNSKTINATDTNTVTDPFAPPIDPTPAICPPNHQMYYLGDNPPSNASNSLSYNWVNGTTRKTYTFTGSNNNRTNLTLSFLDIIDADDNQPNGFGYQKVPFYVKNFDVTTGAINLGHKSTGKKTNHKLQVIIDKPVSKFGFVIQDIDSTGNSNGGRSGRVQYIEQVDVSESGGTLDHNPSFHTINASSDIVTSKDRVNCKRFGGGIACPINATWGYKASNTPFILKHNNVATNSGNIQHVVGYSDFYFCLAPPKVVINKVLNGQRVHDADDNSRDQFKISITDTNNTYSREFITEGSADSIAPGKDNSGTLTLKPNSTYTIAETIINGSANDYTTTYECTNTTTSSATNLPQNGKGKSFSLSNLNYGDDIVCTITNTPVEGPAPTISVKKNLPNGLADSDDRFTFNLYKDEDQPDNKLEYGNTQPGQNNGVYDILTHTLEETDFSTRTYVITEGPFTSGGIPITDMSDYISTYSCIDNNKPNSSPLFSGTGTEIRLTGLKRAQDIICTFTNTPNAYTFSGIIFNDNGGISSDDEDANDTGRTYTNNPYYFNGQYDPDHGEEGISVKNGDDLKVQLVNCDNNKPLQNQSFTLNDNGEAGRYKITIPTNQVTLGEVCLLQKEPASWQDSSNNDAYSVDTTPNKIKLNVSNSKYHYPDNNFGEVKQINAALVLTKRQYINPTCDSDITTPGTDDNASPTKAYSKKAASDVVPNQCIAYQLEAFNRSHVDLSDVIVSDTLQKKGIDGSQITLKFDSRVTPSADPQYNNMSVNTNETDNSGKQIVKFSKFDLSQDNRKRKLYFNTIYTDEQ